MKKKLCLIYILILALLLIPNIAFAETMYYDSTGDLANAFPLSVALFMEAFISIHMSVFVLFPISAIITKTTTKETFLKLFITRIIILLFFDFFVTPAIALVDFFAVFIGAFIVVPIMGMSKASKTNSTKKDAWKEKQDVFTTNNNSTEEECERIKNLMISKVTGNKKIDCNTCGTTYNVAKTKNVNPVQSGIEIGNKKPVKTGISFSSNKPIKKQPIKLGGDEPIKEDEHNNSPIKFN